MSDFWQSLVSGFFGGGAISILTTFWTLRNKDKADQRAEDAITLHTLISVRSELNAVYQRYYSEAGRLFEDIPSQDAPVVFILIEEEYFPVYKNNTSIIGKISREETIVNIVSCYTLAVGMIDSLRFNNSLYDKFNALTSEIRGARDEGEIRRIGNEITHLKQDIAQYWEKLRQHHFELKRIASLAYVGMGEEIERRKKPQ